MRSGWRADDQVVRRLRRVRILAPDGPLHHYPTINAAVRDFRAGRSRG